MFLFRLNEAPVPPPSQGTLASFVRDDQFCDVRISGGRGGGDRIVRAIQGHRVILAMASKQLGARFKQKPERGALIQIEGADFNCVKKLFSLIYTGKALLDSDQGAADFARVLRHLDIKAEGPLPEQRDDASELVLREEDFVVETILGKRSSPKKKSKRSKKKKKATLVSPTASLALLPTSRQRPRQAQEVVDREGVVVEKTSEPKKQVGESISSGTRLQQQQQLKSGHCRNVRYSQDPEQASEAVIFDSHCHLDRLLRGGETFSKFKQENFAEFGSKFEGCISVICNPRDWIEKGWCHRFLDEPGVHGAYGCHPSFAASYDDCAEQALRRCLQRPKVVALGEIGLDSVWGRDKDQELAFGRQLSMAKELGKPICLHVRNKDKRAMEMLKESGLSSDWPIHLHCFSEDWSVGERWMKEWTGMKFGLVPDHFNLELARSVPMDRILLETDAPYFRPNVLGGRKGGVGHPGHVFHVAQQLAEVKGISVDEVLCVNRYNLREVYGI